MPRNPDRSEQALQSLAQLVANAMIPAVGEVGLFGMVTSPGPSPLLPVGVAVVGAAALCSSCWSLGARAVTFPPALLRARGRFTMLVFATTCLQALFPVLTLLYAAFCVAGLARVPAPTPTQTDALLTWAFLTGVNVTALVGLVTSKTLRAWRASGEGAR